MSSPINGRSLDHVVSRIKRLEEAQRKANRTPQLGNSSIEDGAVNVYQGGQLTAVIGQQHDGSAGIAVVGGPTPPTPGLPGMEVANSGVLVTWDGSFVQTMDDRVAGRPTVAPMGFRRVAVEVAGNPDFADAQPGGDIISASGGSLFVPWTAGGLVYARLVCWTDAGKFSAPSLVAGPVQAGKIGIGDLGFDLSTLGGTTVYFGPGDPSDDSNNALAYGDLWLKQVAAGPPPQYETYRWTVVAGVDAWALVQDQGVSEALAQAVAAQDLAADANALAQAASATASAAQTAVAAKITAFYQPAAPTSGMNTGDLWLDTDDGNKLYRYSGSAWVSAQDAAIQQALTVAGDAQATADGKVVTFAQNTPPTATSIGDLWVDLDDGNRMYRWDGSTWANVRDAGITQAVANAATALTTAQDAQAAADGKVTAYFQTTAPTGLTAADTGDLWFDIDDGNKMYRWSGSTWAESSDTRIGQAVTAAADARTVADRKIVTFYQTSAPTSQTVGDLWVDTDDGNRLYRWSGTAWVDVRDTGIGTALANAAAAQATAATKITSFYQPAAPTTGMQAGDFWLDTDDGNKLYRYSGTTWVTAQDAQIQAALTQAGTAQATADQKVRTYFQTAAPTGLVAGDVGDLWFDTDDGNKMYSWTGTAWTVAQDTAIATALANAAAAQTTANAKITAYYQPAAPTTGMQAGDLWVDTDDNSLHRYSGTTWLTIQDAAISTALANAATAQATADGKMRIYVQNTFPAGLNLTTDLGDLLIKTDEGNATYTWTFVPGSPGAPAVPSTPGQPYIPPRTNLVANSSFEAQAVGTYTTITSWTGLATTAGTVTRSIISTGAVAGTRAVRAVGTSLTTATTSRLGYQQVITGFAPGDTLRVSATAWVTAAGTNHPIIFYGEWLNASGTYLSDAFLSTGTGNTGNQVFAPTATAAPAAAAQLRVSIYRRGSGAGTALTNADINADAVLVEKNVAAGTPTAFIETSDPGQPFVAATSGSPAVPAVPDSGAWTKRALGNGAIQPKSLVASDVIATGTVSAALLEALMVLTNVVVAGNPAGEHARFDSTGLGAFVVDPIDNIPAEVARFGASSGGRDPLTGRLAWQITPQGVATVSQLVSNSTDPVFGGTTLQQRDWERPWGLVGYADIPPFTPGAFTQAVPDELGIVELAFNAVPGREYQLCHDAFEMSTDWAPSNTNLGERGTAAIRARLTTDNTAALTTTTNVVVDRQIGDVKAIYSSEIAGEYLIGGPAAPARNPGETFAAWTTRIGTVPWRILLSFAAVPAPNNDGSTGLRWIRMGRFTPAKAWIEDVGPQRPNIGRLTSGLPTTNPNPAPPAPVPKTTRTVDYPVTWSGSWPESNGFSASHRQGWIYQGYSNGYDTYGAQAGAWGWDHNLVRNDVTGAQINRVEIFMYAYHWWNGSGGTARIGASHGTGTGGAIAPQIEWFERGFARAQGQWIDITSWAWRLPLPLSDGNNMTSITVGVGTSHDLQYYGYFAGLGDVAGRYPALRCTFTK